MGVRLRHFSPGVQALLQARSRSDDEHGGQPIFKLRLTGPKGGQTLFGIDRRNYAIRTMEFATPKGWHLRTYANFVELKNPRRLQARTVTLYYNGFLQTRIFWSDVVVDAALDDAMFARPRR